MTQCNGCYRKFLDKYYLEDVHKVICPWCGKINATVDIDDKMQVILMGLRYDIGTQGAFGGTHMRSWKDIKKIFKKVYGDQAKAKINELLNNLQLTQEQFQTWFKMKKEMQKT